MRSAQVNLFLFEHQERPSVVAKVHGVLQFTQTITQLHLTSKKLKMGMVHVICYTHSPNVALDHIKVSQTPEDLKLKAFQTNHAVPLTV